MVTRKMIPNRNRKWVGQFIWVFSAILAGYVGGQLPIFLGTKAPTERLICRELQIVDASGAPLITLVSGKAGPTIKLTGKDGIQTLSLEVIDTITSVDNRMARIAFGHSALEGNQINLSATRDKRAHMFMGQHDSYGSIYMSADPFGTYPSSALTVGYFSGPRIECFANSKQTQLKVGTGGSYVHAGKIGERLPYLQIEDSEKQSLIELIERNKKPSR